MFIYIAAIIVCISGLYMIMSAENYLAKIVGLIIFQNSILIFFIAFGKISNAHVPIDTGAAGAIYSSPVPHVLMLTAIVVGFATTLLAMALIILIHRNFGSLNISDLDL